jgi:hypothetical protein
LIDTEEGHLLIENFANIYFCNIFIGIVAQSSRLLYIYKGVDVVEWSRALDVRLSEWCCSVSMVWVQIPSREEQKFDSSRGHHAVTSFTKPGPAI